MGNQLTGKQNAPWLAINIHNQHELNHEISSQEIKTPDHELCSAIWLHISQNSAIYRFISPWPPSYKEWEKAITLPPTSHIHISLNYSNIARPLLLNSAPAQIQSERGATPLFVKVMNNLKLPCKKDQHSSVQTREAAISNLTSWNKMELMVGRCSCWWSTWRIISPVLCMPSRIGDSYEMAKSMVPEARKEGIRATELSKMAKRRPRRARMSSKTTLRDMHRPSDDHAGWRLIHHKMEQYFNCIGYGIGFCNIARVDKPVTRPRSWKSTPKIERDLHRIPTTGVVCEMAARERCVRRLFQRAESPRRRSIMMPRDTLWLGSLVIITHAIHIANLRLYTKVTNSYHLP